MEIKRNTGVNEFAKKMAEAVRNGDEKAFSEAFQKYTEGIASDIKAEYEIIKDETDSKILAARGYRQLTSKENDFYQKWIETAKQSNYKQAFDDLIVAEGMPETIIEDVFTDLTTEHPLLSKINFIYVKFLTKWLLNNQEGYNYAWGKIDSKIVEEILAGFKDIKLDQAQLSAFMAIGVGMLDLGPKFLDAYVRKVLKEALSLGLEYGIIYGSGVNCLTGLTKKVGKGVQFSEETGYPDKEKIEITDFTPLTYGPIVAKLSKSESGRKRSVKDLTLVTNPTDYLTKIMPATTILNAAGVYVNNLFPIPTDVVESEIVKDNEAILFLPKHYFCGVGNNKNGEIKYSDEYRFLENMRTYKALLYATGKAADDNVAIVLDISKLNPTYLNVKMITDTAVSTAQVTSENEVA